MDKAIVNLKGPIERVIENFNAMLFVLEYDDKERFTFIPAIRLPVKDGKVYFSVFVGLVQNGNYNKELSIVLIPYSEKEEDQNVLVLGQISMNREVNIKECDETESFQGKRLMFDKYEFRQNFKLNYELELDKTGEYAVVLVNSSVKEITDSLRNIVDNALSIYYFEVV